MRSSKRCCIVRSRLPLDTDDHFGPSTLCLSDDISRFETVLHVDATRRCTHSYCTQGSFFFHSGPSTALLANSGESCTSAAAATKPAVLPTIGQGSDVLLTMGPMPKLINSEPHSGANSNDQTHFLRTGPAEEAPVKSVTHLVLSTSHG